MPTGVSRTVGLIQPSNICCLKRLLTNTLRAQRWSKHIRERGRKIDFTRPCVLQVFHLKNLSCCLSVAGGAIAWLVIVSLRLTRPWLTSLTKLYLNMSVCLHFVYYCDHGNALINSISLLLRTDVCFLRRWVSAHVHWGGMLSFALTFLHRPWLCHRILSGVLKKRILIVWFDL